MTIWFTSDLHLGHENIIRYCNRPFANAGEMNESLIKNWNARVKPSDEVYVLGDVAMCPAQIACNLVRRLNGKLYLIEGNHDDKNLRDSEFRSLFIWSKQIHELSFQDPSSPKGKRGIVLCHYAMRVWNRSHHGAYHLYGHSHGTLPDDPKATLSMDVGVDSHNYAPISLEEVKDIMSKRKWVSPFANVD